LDAVAVQLSLSLIVLFISLLSLLFEVLSDVPLEDHCTTTAASNPFLLLLALAALLGPPLAQTLSDRVLDYLRQEE
jgi:ACR3 family arsenite efflux pump ArsB